MEFSKLILQRQSCRSYDPDKQISKEDLEKILDAGRLSPSACNFQQWLFYCATGDKKQEVAQACQDLGKNKFLSDCSAIITIILDKPNLEGSVVKALKRDFRPYDAGIAIANMTLQAKDLGIDSCIIGWINDGKLRKALGLNKNAEIGMVIALGYAPEGYETRQKVRKSADRVVKYL